ncbi:MAG TPA: hypothetical protein VD995_32680 [Azospirillum sp.]|nr:hypothetical protein [Azospirillum sp.]
MLRASLITTLGALALLSFSSGTTFAVSPSEEECAGEFDRDRGEVTCEENVGNSENSQTTTNSGQGNLTNEKKVTCEGPGGSGENSAHCK